MSRSMTAVSITIALVTLLSACSLAPTVAPPTATASPAPSPVPLPPPAETGRSGTPISFDTAASVERLRTLEGHSARVYGVAFSYDGGLLASASMDGTVRLWDPTTWQVIREFEAPDTNAMEVFFLADNAHVSSDTGTVWDIASGETEHVLSSRHRVTLSPDSVWMAASGFDSLAIELWSVKDWRLVWETPTGHVGRIYALGFSPDSRLLATAPIAGPADTSDYTVKLWDVATGQEVSTLAGHRADVHAVAFSPDGRWLASASIDTTVRVWDLQSGQLRHTLYHGDGMYDVTFSPDSSLLATAVCDRTVKLWDVAGGRLARTLRHGDEVMSVAFSPDGSLLASGAYDNKVYLWGIPR